jgi:hypothetical protein
MPCFSVEELCRLERVFPKLAAELRLLIVEEGYSLRQIRDYVREHHQLEIPQVSLLRTAINRMGYDVIKSIVLVERGETDSVPHTPSSPAQVGMA